MQRLLPIDVAFMLLETEPSFTARPIYPIQKSVRLLEIKGLELRQREFYNMNRNSFSSEKLTLQKQAKLLLASLANEDFKVFIKEKYLIDEQTSERNNQVIELIF